MERLSLDALFVGRPGDDDAARGARVACAMYVGAALIVLLTLPLLSDGMSRGPDRDCRGRVARVRAPDPHFPWSRWGAGYLVWLPVAGYVILGIIGLIVLGRWPLTCRGRPQRDPPAPPRPARPGDRLTTPGLPRRKVL